MTTTERTELVTAWEDWHAERERLLATPHGWLSLTGLYWLDTSDRGYADLPGTWRATGDGGVEITTAPGDGVVVDGALVYGTTRLDPVDGAPGVLVTVGDRQVELARREHHIALRVRDPEAPTRRAFTGVPAYDVEERWIVEGRFVPYAEPVGIVVDTVIDGLGFHPTAVGTVTFTLDGAPQELVALADPEGLKLHFRDATSGEGTYGGGRQLRTPAPDDEGRVTIDLNRTVNLPCALTAFATCPLPPAGNVVTVRVEAGETLPG
jgi:hypothetical protein